jgi:AcrR family transcriptional regulator
MSVTPTGSERQRHPPEVRRRLILEAARRCIAARGLEGTTIREIAKEADISIGTITYHFSGVQDILAEALREASENFTKRFLEEADSQTGTRNRLRYIVDVNLPVDDERRSLWRLWLELWARASRDPALAEVHSERHAYERVAIAAIVDDAVERGEVRPVDSTAFALNFLGLLDGLGLQALIGDTGVGVETARAALYSTIDASLDWLDRVVAVADSDGRGAAS